MSGERPHETVLLHEAVENLVTQPDGTYLDGTFGRGGHSKLILQKLNAHGRLIALDKDDSAVQIAQRLQDERFQIVHQGFEHLQTVLRSLNIEQVDGILLDLGVSSPQLDEAERGFSFRFDAPLDMRMDRTRGQTAAQWLNEVEENFLSEILREYGEERFARKIARTIIAARQECSLSTTRQLSELVAQAIPTREAGKNPATRTFQAIRIYINQELEALQSALPQCLAKLKPKGRLVVISFHSLEDRIVKRFMRDMAQGDHLPKNLPFRADQIPQAKMRLIGKPIQPSAEELAKNPRARSAVLRIAELTGLAHA